MTGTPAAAPAPLVCGRCGYGISVALRPLPPCPMCRSQLWRPGRGRA